MRRVYIDTSAYLCELLGEDGAAEVAEAIDGALLHSSTLLVLEVRRNLVRVAREGRLPERRLHEAFDRLQRDLEWFVTKDLTLDLCADASMPALTTPRSLDLAHLRTALWFHRQKPLDAYVTRDDGQRQSARELGLPIG